jgi:hypothetical protein
MNTNKYSNKTQTIPTLVNHPWLSWENNIEFSGKACCVENRCVNKIKIKFRYTDIVTPMRTSANHFLNKNFKTRASRWCVMYPPYIFQNHRFLWNSLCVCVCCWRLNPGPCTHQAGAVHLSYVPSPIKFFFE